ncbi:MAG: hypothetical protein GY873_04440 [Bosea sp.]|uniref:hypothetical protein n=1 Tax=Bosea sp. (in: a-proteobacteria) TaxID=1871050 RepID=UPI002384C747|nr:hypothetical protein [Bosea sp. (in: a-proteobacteria)]MCP4733425.1 hypothetical protein [Bosea sp. (in: a-proteobacteria)]
MEQLLPLELHIFRAAHFAFCEGEQLSYQPPRFTKRTGNIQLYLLDVESPLRTFAGIKRRELDVSVKLRSGLLYLFKLTFSNGHIAELDKWDETVEMISTDDFHVDEIEMQWFDVAAKLGWFDEPVSDSSP